MKFDFVSCLAVIAFLGFACQPEKNTEVSNEMQPAARPGEAKNTAVTGWNLTSVKGPVLEFGNGNKINTKLTDLTFIGQVSPAEEKPYFIYSGRYCNQCDARKMLYITQAGDSVRDVRYGKNRLMHPGVMKDYESGEILYKARSFYGTVLDNTTGIIWYQESLSDYGSYIPNIFLIKLDENGRTDTSFAFTNSYLQQTLALFEKGACKEVKGVEYLSEP